MFRALFPTCFLPLRTSCGVKKKVFVLAYDFLGGSGQEDDQGIHIKRDSWSMLQPQNVRRLFRTVWCACCEALRPCSPSSLEQNAVAASGNAFRRGQYGKQHKCTHLSLIRLLVWLAAISWRLTLVLAYLAAVQRYTTHSRISDIWDAVCSLLLYR